MEKTFDQLEFDENYQGYEKVSTSSWPKPVFEVCPECGRKTLGVLLCVNCGHERNEQAKK